MPKYPKIIFNVGEVIGDYECIEKDVSELNNNLQHKWKCKICGHETIDSYNNIKKSHTHSYKKCDKEFFDLEWKNKIINDMKIIEYIEPSKIKLQCIYCRKERVIERSQLNHFLKLKTKLQCINDDCRLNRLLQHDKMTKIDTYTKNGIRYVKYKCNDCGAIRETPYTNFIKAEHCIQRCTKYFYELYNVTKDEIKFMRGSWSSILMRTEKHEHYLNIKNLYKDYVDFVKDILPKLQEYKKKHNIKNIKNKKMEYSVDRINPNRHYEANNTRIASIKLQSINQKRSHNKFLIQNINTKEILLSNSTPDTAKCLQVTVGAIGNLLRGSSKTMTSKITNEKYIGRELTQEEFNEYLKKQTLKKLFMKNNANRQGMYKYYALYIMSLCQPLYKEGAETIL